MRGRRWFDSIQADQLQHHVAVFGEACSKGGELALQVGCGRFDSDPLHRAASEVFSVARLASNQEERVRPPPDALVERVGASSTRVTGGVPIAFDLLVADPNGQGPVCKTGARGFDSRPPLHAPVVQRKDVGLLSREVAVRIRPGVPFMPA